MLLAAFLLVKRKLWEHIFLGFQRAYPLRPDNAYPGQQQRTLPAVSTGWGVLFETGKWNLEQLPISERSVWLSRQLHFSRELSMYSAKFEFMTKCQNNYFVKQAVWKRHFYSIIRGMHRERKASVLRNCKASQATSTCTHIRSVP